uniref:Uncharacterized protein n=1 Tax=Melopsittacus undulatus TaxID=13146 RepID=A0A8V5GJG8_MELUD
KTRFLGSNTPFLVSETPFLGSKNPLFGVKKPIFWVKKPIFGVKKPIFGVEKPVFGLKTPVFGVKNPVFGPAEPPRSRWLQVDGAEAALELHDGDEEAAAHADALLLVFSLTDRASFAALGPAARGFRGGAEPQAPPLLLVANKSDLARARHVTAREVRSLASVLRCGHVETSAELRMGTEELFARAVREGRGHRRRLHGDDAGDVTEGDGRYGDGRHDDGRHGDGRALRRRRSLTGRAKRFLAGLVPLSRQRSRSCG